MTTKTKKKIAKPIEGKSKKIRTLILENVGKTVDELMELLPKGTKKQAIYDSKTKLRQRYGEGEFENHNGKLNRSELIRRALKINPGMSVRECVDYLAGDGIKITEILVRQQIAAFDGRHPDPNVNKGPRARKVKKTKNNVQKLNESGLDTRDSYMLIELELEHLVNRATELGNERLAEIARHARRLASAELI